MFGLGLKYKLQQLLYEAGLRLNLIILPKSYYVPIADSAELRRSREWMRQSSLLGIDFDLDEQVKRLREICAPYRDEYRENPHFLEASGGGFGLGYGYIEAQALHSVVRWLKPSRIIEVGSGISTYCMLQASLLNERDTGQKTLFTCIEPYPSHWLLGAPVELIRRRVEHVEPSLFEQLGPNDLLFIDSSHTVKIGGDVPFLYLEVLPRLHEGVTVHIHDIYLPYNYQRDADRTLYQWMETAFLQAFLMFNKSFAIEVCLSHLHYQRRDALRDIFPEYEPQMDNEGLANDGRGGTEGHFPASIYIRSIQGTPARR